MGLSCFTLGRSRCRGVGPVAGGCVGTRERDTRGPLRHIQPEVRGCANGPPRAASGPGADSCARSVRGECHDCIVLGEPSGNYSHVPCRSTWHPRSTVLRCSVRYRLHYGAGDVSTRPSEHYKRGARIGAGDDERSDPWRGFLEFPGSGSASRNPFVGRRPEPGRYSNLFGRTLGGALPRVDLECRRSGLESNRRLAARRFRSQNERWVTWVGSTGGMLQDTGAAVAALEEETHNDHLTGRRPGNGRAGISAERPPCDLRAKVHRHRRRI